jgi:hypothetical protein
MASRTYVRNLPRSESWRLEGLGHDICPCSRRRRPSLAVRVVECRSRSLEFWCEVVEGLQYRQVGHQNHDGHRVFLQSL